MLRLSLPVFVMATHVFTCVHAHTDCVCTHRFAYTHVQTSDVHTHLHMVHAHTCIHIHITEHAYPGTHICKYRWGQLTAWNPGFHQFWFS